MSTKIFFTDLDGTLLNSNDEISDKNMYGLKKLKDSGIITAIATGRSIQTSRKYIELMKPDYYVGFNGSFILDVNNNDIILKEFFNHDTANELANIFDKEDIAYTICCYDGIYCRSKEKMLLSGIGQEYINRFINILNEFDSVYDIEPVTFFAMAQNSEKAKRITDIISTFNTLQSSETMRKGFDIIPKSIDKAYAVKYLCNHLSIPIINSAAAGDGYNDLTMLKTVNHSFAMSNAPLDVQEAAKNILPDMDSDGIYYACMQIMDI